MAPEVLSEKIELIDWEKSDVYSLGLTLLQASTLEEIKKLNKLSVKEFDEILKKKVKSEYMRQILKNMIHIDPNKRSTFKELNQRTKGLY